MNVQTPVLIAICSLIAGDKEEALCDLEVSISGVKNIQINNIDSHWEPVVELLQNSLEFEASDVADNIQEFIYSNHHRQFTDCIGQDDVEKAMDRDSCLSDSIADYIIDKEMVLDWLHNNL